MLKQSVTYNKEELINNTMFMKSSLKGIEFYVRMMEEQGAGKRDNLDWESVSEALRKSVEDLKRGIGNFGTVSKEDLDAYHVRIR